MFMPTKGTYLFEKYDTEINYLENGSWQLLLCS